MAKRQPRMDNMKPTPNMSNATAQMVTSDPIKPIAPILALIVPAHVVLALRTILNHVEPGWDNCKTTVEQWLEQVTQPKKAKIGIATIEPRPQRMCANIKCDVVFTPKSHNHKFCSYKCKDVARKKP